MHPVALADEYVWRTVLAGVILSGLAYWQLHGGGESASSKVLGELQQTVIVQVRSHRPLDVPKPQAVHLGCSRSYLQRYG
jgi:hypothetical protein